MERIRNGDMYRRDIEKLAVSMDDTECARLCTIACLDLSSYTDKNLLKANDLTANKLLASKIADMLIMIDVLKYRQVITDNILDDYIRDNLFRKVRLIKKV